MVRHIVSALLIGLSYSWAATPSDAALGASAMASIMTRCSGLYDAAALIEQSSGRNANAKIMEARANNAQRTATALLVVSGTPKDQAETTAWEGRRSQALYHLAFLQTGSVGTLISALGRCTKDYLP